MGWRWTLSIRRTSRNVADLICNEFGIEMTSRNVRHILPTLGLSPQKPVLRETLRPQVAL